MTKKNEIIGGTRGGDVCVFFDGADIYEVHDIIANDGFGRSIHFGWHGVNDMWNNKEEEKELREKFPTMSDEAVKAILRANLRGVYANVIYTDHKRIRYEEEKWDLVRAISRLPQKEWEKVQKILKK